METKSDLCYKSIYNVFRSLFMENKVYRNKLAGAIIGRFAGCALGAPVELMQQRDLIAFAKKIKQDFPPKDYFIEAPDPDSKRYLIGKGRDFTKGHMSFLSTDDDIAYTLLSLINMEKYGKDLTTANIASSWLKYLPLECTFTAERTTLKNLRNGINPNEAAIKDNFELEYIGAAIRIDGYGYVNPGNPGKAAAMAYQDAYLSHRNSGIDSAVYFAALISLAFESTDIVKSMYEALDFVDKNGEFYRNISWALAHMGEVKDHLIANALVTKRFENMSPVHAINNACLTIWGINIGKNDYEKGIAYTVAMAYDNDCTAATVGSVLGAYQGIDSIAEKWYKPWNNKIKSYLNGIEEFMLDDVIERFYTLGTSR